MNILDKLQLLPNIRNQLETAQINTAKLLLEASNDDLLKANLSETDIQLVKLQAANMCNVNICCAVEARRDNISVGCRKLDAFLRGGVALGGGITEIVGESGSGKTQLCLQMSLMVQYPIEEGGAEGGAVYICTEGESLKQCVTVRLPQLLVRNKIKLIILDSIAGVFRADYEVNTGASRAKDLQVVGVQLHKLAQQFKMAIVCVNQVTDVPSKELGKHQSVAALGLAWANLVTTRIQLSRMSQKIRKMEVIFSPHLPSECCHFSVTEGGVAAIF